jgi:hypothetical protein
MDTVKEILASDFERNGSTYYEVQPYEEVRLGGTPWVVYHQGDEEQTATVNPKGELHLIGPRDWTVRCVSDAPAYADVMSLIVQYAMARLVADTTVPTKSQLDSFAIVAGHEWDKQDVHRLEGEIAAALRRAGLK